jgi:tripartite-type tricarboxylate transporter receptor subunit TctC
MARVRSLLCKAAGIVFAFTAAAAAQDYPSKPVRIVVPFPPGAFNDQVGRIIAAELTERLGKQFIVDNRGGAGGIIGAEIVANAPKDGHTLLIVSLATAVNPWLYKLPFEPVKAFEPISIIVTAPNVVAVYPGLPAHSIKDLVTLAKQQPGAIQYGSSGVGTFVHLGGELFKMAAGIDMLHVPFKGTAPAMVDLMGGNTKVTFGSTASTMPHLRSGKVRALAVGGRQRSPALPDVPTVIEAGVDYEAANWIGLVAPAGTPAAIVQRLHKEIADIQKTARGL